MNKDWRVQVYVKYQQRYTSIHRRFELINLKLEIHGKRNLSQIVNMFAIRH